jgi:hypothetical protein
MARSVFTEKALRYRENLRAQVVRYDNGDEVALNGCLPADDYDSEVLDELQGSAVSITTWASGDMPIFKLDNDFMDYLTNRRKACEHLVAAGYSWLPWDVLKALPRERKVSDHLYFSQGSVPSCMNHSSSFSHHSVTLIDIALGQPLVYNPINPIVTWYLSKGRSMRGGQTVSVMAKWVNDIGNFPIADVGRDNTTVPSSYKNHYESAKKNQSGICFIEVPKKELVDAAIEVLQSGLPIALGNSTAVRGAKVDSNKMRVAVLGGSWSHATHLVGHREVNNTEYYGWINSHGARYGTGADGMPADGCWMTKEILKQFLSTASNFGYPYVVLPEAPVKDHNSLERIVSAPISVLPLK